MSTTGVFSTSEGIMMHVGYHEYIEGCSVHRGYHDASGGISDEYMG